MKKGDKVVINDSVLGEITVVIKDILGNVVKYESSLLNHSGMCHIEIFEKMMVK